MTYNIISDIAGRYDELLLLLAKMPKADKIILVGDLVDRGNQSKQVIEWSMNNPDVIALKGNHEDMMVDYLSKTNKYDQGIWIENGGSETLNSYNTEEIEIPKEHIQWLESLAISYKDDGLFISHAPWSDDAELGTIVDDSVLWNRYPPKKHEGVFQVFGHNSSLKQYGNYAICIDNCSRKVLTGLHWPTKEIFEQEYL